MNYKIESLPNQSLQSPHADEFYVIRLYSQDDLWNNEDLLGSDEIVLNQGKNKLITKHKILLKKSSKEYLKMLEHYKNNLEKKMKNGIINLIKYPL